MTNSSSNPKKVVLVVSTEDAAKWQPVISSIWLPVFGPKLAEEAIEYKAWEGTLPTVEDLAPTKERIINAVVVTGSHYHANDLQNIASKSISKSQEAWLAPLRDWIRNFRSHHPGVPLLCSCFGHQIAAISFGGSVDRNPSDKFVLKVEDVVPVEGSAAFFQQLESGTEQKTSTPGEKGFTKQTSSCDTNHSDCNSYEVFQCHGDTVIERAEDSVHVHSSASCQFETLYYPPNVLSVQYHPEFTLFHLYDKIVEPVTQNCMKVECAEAARVQLEERGGSAVLGCADWAEHILRPFCRAVLERGSTRTGTKSGI